MNSSSVTNLFDQLPNGYRMDRRLGPVFDQPPAAADDLTLIRGIDTREAVILNRLGVYFLSQIALWKSQEACFVADELGMQASALADEQWVEQARVLCRPRPSGPKSVAPHLPASFVRTMSLLTCALLVGFLVVYWLSLQANAPMRGVLSADITSLRVPAESKLLASHVQPGQEVFSGDALLTLEKTEHLAMITLQERRVVELQRQLEQAEAQAALDLAWRTRELERELSDVRSRAQLIQEVKRASPVPLRSASNPRPIRQIDGTFEQKPSTATLRSIVPRQTIRRRPAVPNTMVFIGSSGEHTVDVPRAPLQLPAAAPGRIEPQRLVLASEPRGSDVLTVEERTIEQRLQQLETLRQALPLQVRRAAGVEGIRVQHDEAAQRLKEMKTLSRDIAVLCPGYGKVGQIRYKPGDTMSTGEIMLKILHSDRRYIVLNVPTQRINEIQPGVAVDLVFPGDEHFRGRISGDLPMVAEPASVGRQSLVTVRVEPAGRLWPEIPIGSQIDVTIDDRG